MTGKTHVYCGTAVLLCLTIKHPLDLQIMDASYITALGLLTVGIGSIAPDVDLKQSKAGRKIPWLSKMLTHRGITHTLLIPALLAAAMYYLKQLGVLIVPELLLGLNVGWIAHILADMFNAKGVPILWPLSSSKIHFFKFVTGTWHETLFSVLVTGGLLACLILL